MKTRDRSLTVDIGAADTLLMVTSDSELKTPTKQPTYGLFDLDEYLIRSNIGYGELALHQ